MSDDHNPRRKRDLILKTFLGGVAIGVIFGLLTTSLWGGIGPYQAQISAGFWGLLGGLVGMGIGFVYRKL
jgi:hypothetical protein